jgi:hypothetical protein
MPSKISRRSRALTAEVPRDFAPSAAALAGRMDEALDVVHVAHGLVVGGVAGDVVDHRGRRPAGQRVADVEVGHLDRRSATYAVERGVLSAGLHGHVQRQPRRVGALVEVRGQQR